MARLSTNLGQIGVEEAGGGDRTPLVFLHGVGSDKSVWRPQLEHFGAERRAIALDYPGYGESAFVAGADRDGFAAAVLAAMSALGIQRAHLCGLSLGGVIAIAAHAAAPERCASLILADTFALHPEGPAIRDRSSRCSSTIASIWSRSPRSRRAPCVWSKPAPTVVPMDRRRSRWDGSTSGRDSASARPRAIAARLSAMPPK